MPNAMQCFQNGRIYIVFLFFVSSSSAVVLEIQDAQCYAVLSHRTKIDQNGGLCRRVDVTL